MVLMLGGGCIIPIILVWVASEQEQNLICSAPHYQSLETQGENLDLHQRDWQYR